ncbi:hypothetical protein ABB27_03790 [Stenotrophomonas terrae]|uniref:Type I restriction modification DNA specificity domain-containing protein n=1 Tax=Stenotrophomonas terrae TaxID=405446 RepID=A0A0R0CXY0_9GAMM|nr:hypothetical protein [Stenotrophomonas terrae]KRG71378.1 hypothetical protein ABB27_03790 [Stenotrophomonas terrae]
MTPTRRHTSFKPSGARWLGDVPVHWDVKPLWSMYKPKKITGHPIETLLSVYRDYGVIEKSSRDDNKNRESEDLSGYQLVVRGDLVTNKMKTWQGSIAVSGLQGIVSPAYYVYDKLHAGNDSFFHHLFRSSPFVTGYQSISKGIRVGQWDLEADKFRLFPVLIPPRPEQDAIVAYLDGATSRIDTLVVKKTRFIELLREKRQALITHAVTKGLDPNMQMKDSGIEWLGKVPTHWTIPKLRHIASVQTGLALGKSLSGPDVISVPYLRVANVQDGYLKLDDVATVNILRSDLDRYRLQANDVLMNEGGDNDKLGRGHIWRDEIANCVHQNHVFAIRPHGVSSEWLNAYKGSTSAQSFFTFRSKQTTNLASISSSNLRDLPVPRPPEEEQVKILAHISSATSRIDTLIAKTERSVELLREHRTALITAAVTGKIALSN